MPKLALFSVDSRQPVTDFARALISRGWQVLATDAPLEAIRKSGLPVVSLAEFTGYADAHPFPATLHPKIEAALTDEKSAQRIELVYDIVYGPHAGIDVGGNSLLALAVKGKRVAVPSSAAMRSVIASLSAEGEVPEQLRQSLAKETLSAIAGYYAQALGLWTGMQAECLIADTLSELANGENPYQRAWLMGLREAEEMGLPGFRHLAGPQPCFTNLADLDALTEVMIKITGAFRLNYAKIPFICLIAKHGNPCGIGADWHSPEAAIERALWGSPLAAWGGEVAVNFFLEEGAARSLFSSPKRRELFADDRWMFDVIAVPGLSKEAGSVLSARRQAKIFLNSYLSTAPARKGFHYRFVRGGLLKQTCPDYLLDISGLAWNVQDWPSEKLDDLIIAWAAAYGSFHGGNEVAMAKDGMLLSCAGGPSTVDAVATALMRAEKLGHKLCSAAFCADAFFPFTDAPGLLADAGVACGIVPAGGLRWQQVKDFFTGRGIAVGFIAEKFRGFCRH